MGARKKNTILTMVILTCFVLLSVGLSHDIKAVFAATPSSSKVFQNNRNAIFPAELQVIDDEAFLGTSLYKAFFDRKLEYIGQKAFFGIKGLKYAYLPPSVLYIDDDAFPHNTLIYSTRNSYAQEWAAETGHEFQINDIWNNNLNFQEKIIDIALTIICFSVPIDIKDILLKRISIYFRSMRPQDRPELYPINYRFP